MKLLLDSCVWGGAASALRTIGYDVVAAAEWDHDPGDEQILRTAVADERVLVTLDKDFGELAIIDNIRHVGILRLVKISGHRQAEITHVAMTRYALELKAGAIVTAEQHRFRIRCAD